MRSRIGLEQGDLGIILFAKSKKRSSEARWPPKALYEEIISRKEEQLPRRFVVLLHQFDSRLHICMNEKGINCVRRLTKVIGRAFVCYGCCQRALASLRELKQV